MEQPYMYIQIKYVAGMRDVDHDSHNDLNYIYQSARANKRGGHHRRRWSLYKTSVTAYDERVIKCCVTRWFWRREQPVGKDRHIRYPNGCSAHHIDNEGYWGSRKKSGRYILLGQVDVTDTSDDVATLRQIPLVLDSIIGMGSIHLMEREGVNAM